MLFRLGWIVQWVSGHLSTVFSVRGGEAPPGERGGETPPSFQLLLWMRGEKGGKHGQHMGSADPACVAFIHKMQCNLRSEQAIQNFFR